MDPMHPQQRRVLLLVDGNALVHRAFHALPPLTTSRTGEMVNAVYGFANTLFKVVSNLKASHWAIAFDYPPPPSDTPCTSSTRPSVLRLPRN